ncbi:hypothetical protein LTS10_011049 [Elasticomyces elasticus]|nr:hypothetical protein LTS10_011049 [Elasticomyces elasticus]
MAAAKAALDTFDLLETILTNLDFFDVLAARAVSRNWSSIVEQSLQLQKTLFRVAAACMPFNPEELHVSLRGGTAPVASIPIASSLSTLPLFRTFGLHYCNPSDHKHVARLAKTWPITCLAGIGETTYTIYSFEWRPDDLHALPQSRLLRGMFLTRPACETMRLTVFGPRDERSTAWDTKSIISHAVLRLPSGIKLGDAVNTIEKMLASTGGREWLIQLAVFVKKSHV